MPYSPKYIDFDPILLVSLKLQGAGANFLDFILILWGNFEFLPHYLAYFPSHHLPHPNLGLNPSWGCSHPRAGGSILLL